MKALALIVASTLATPKMMPSAVRRLPNEPLPAGPRMSLWETAVAGRAPWPARSPAPSSTAATWAAIQLMRPRRGGRNAESRNIGGPPEL